MRVLSLAMFLTFAMTVVIFYAHAQAVPDQKAPTAATTSAPEPGGLPPVAANISVRRFAENPIIRPEMLPGQDGKNINGPSLIRVPEWIPNPLGKYYLYFADHGGQYIRLAYADRLTGPWQVYAPGTLKLAQTPDGRKHIASPDVHIDQDRKEIRMYFHCPSQTVKEQTTYLARSKDGIQFTADKERLSPSYFRLFQRDGYWYAMAKPGTLYRSKDGETRFEAGHNPLSQINDGYGGGRGERVRHVALDVVGDTLHVYWTNIGDTPESILHTTIPLGPDWTTWKAGAPELVLRPETAYEGIDLPVATSNGGRAVAREHAVRDPGIFKEDGHTYLLYSVAGESGIGIAELGVEKPSASQ